MAKKVLLFLSQGFEEYEAAVFTDVLGWSRQLGKEPVEVVTTALRPEVTCTWNLIVKPQLEFEKVNVNDFDALALPGGFHDAGYYDDAFDKRFLQLIRDFNDKGKIIASICVGAIPLGEAGILKGREATTYDLNENVRLDQLKAYGAIIKKKKVVVDGNIITSTGPATGTAVAFKLLELLTSKSNVNNVKKHMRFR
jgi:protein deglycase